VLLVVIPPAVLKDDLIKSFQEQMRIRDEELVSITAELDSCYARLEDSDSLLERFDFLYSFSKLQRAQ
jgi:hypothetical protein